MEKLAFSIKEFCSLHNISRAKLYDLFRRGEGPHTMKVGKKRLISMESAKEWRNRLTRL